MYSNEIIRACKDEDYLDSLTEEQKALVPANQVGIIEMSDEDMEIVAGGLTITNLNMGSGDVNFNEINMGTGDVIISQGSSSCYPCKPCKPCDPCDPCNSPC